MSHSRFADRHVLPIVALVHDRIKSQQVRIVSIALLLAAIVPANQARAGLTALVPAYFYPGGPTLADWAQLDQAAQKINLDVIVNPASGPGTVTDPNYVSAIQNLNATPYGKAFGYISTNFGTRDRRRRIRYPGLPQPLRPSFRRLFRRPDVDPPEYARLLSEHLELYQDPGSFLHGHRQPGQPVSERGFYKQFHVNRGCHEHLRGSEHRPRPRLPGIRRYPYGLNWFQSEPSERLSNIVHDVPADTGDPSQSSAMLADLSKAIQLNAGTVFFTDGTGGNPYSALPSYWDQEVAAIAAASVPEPGSFVLMVSACLLSSLTVAVRRRASR